MHKKPLIAQGWLRALLYLILGIALSVSILTVSNILLLGSAKGSDTRPTGVWALMGSYCLNNLGFVLLAFLMRRLLDRQSIGSLGFQWRGYADSAWSGFFLGILILCIGTLFLLSLQFVYFTGLAVDVGYLLTNILLFIVVAFVEEIIFRGYVLNNLMDSLPKWWALAVSSAAFALFHCLNRNVTPLSIVGVFVGGLFLGVNYIHTRNLWFGIFLHFSWNYFQGTIFGYQVSGVESHGLLRQTPAGPDLWTGGSFGFEGSLLTPILEGLAVLLLARKYRAMETRPDIVR